MISPKNILSENLVYNAKSAPFLDGDFIYSSASTVSYDPSRKSFLGKLIGLLAVAGVAPRLLTKAPAGPQAAAEPAARSVTLRHDARAVARREGSV